MRVLVLAVLVAATARPVFGQGPPSPGADAPIRFGRVAVTPLVSLESGVETNVLNSPVDPQADTFVSVLPSLKTTFNMSRVLLDVTVAVPYTRFSTYRDQGQLGRDGQVNVSVPFNRLTLKAAGGYQDVKQRLNLEIDARTRRVQVTAGAGASLRLTPHMAVEVGVERQDLDYEDSTVDGVNLSDALSERVERVTGTVRRAVTPLTDVVAVFEAKRDRFGGDTTRNADSQRVMVGIQSAALVNGSATVGYASFAPLLQDVPPFKGLVAGIDLQYPFFSTTLVSVQASRDVTFSYQALSPYYVASAVTLSVTRPTVLGLILRAGAGVQLSDYRSVVATDAARRDTGSTYTLGVGRPLGRRLVLGVVGGSTKRRAQGPGVSYGGRRASATLAVRF